MAIYVDTSAIFAVLDADDRYAPAASSAWASFIERRESLITCNYVLVEAFALIGRRLGVAALRAFQAEMVPIFGIHWVDEPLHHSAVTALLTAGARDLSLVDCVSFEVMRLHNVDTAFAFDQHFVQQGFRCIP